MPHSAGCRQPISPWYFALGNSRVPPGPTRLWSTGAIDVGCSCSLGCSDNAAPVSWLQPGQPINLGKPGDSPFGKGCLLPYIYDPDSFIIPAVTLPIMARQVHPKTLFHLVPRNQIAHAALLHPDNLRFVSPNSEDGELGLEIGYHVPSWSQGHVITRLGRDADLTLIENASQPGISRVHVAFEINPTTHLVVLSVRSKRPTSVTFSMLGRDEEAPGQITGDGVILYGQNYQVSIASYNFRLFWRTVSDSATNVRSLEALAVHGWETALKLLQDMKSRDRPTEHNNSEMISWHVTRLGSASRTTIQEVEGTREIIGQGAFGKVYKAIEITTGYHLAIKVVDLTKSEDPGAARALLHREIKMMERLSLKHVGSFSTAPSLRAGF